MKKLFSVVAIAVASISAYAQESVTGAGATFPAPIYSKWADSYNKETGVRINYQSVGSGAGINQIKAKTVAFGASDMPLTDQALEAAGLFQFPTVIGGVVPVVHLPGIKPGELKLTGDVLADIYLGKISNWKDPRIAALNPTLPLPDALIIPIRRADGSGTTFLFTNYLSKVSVDWKSRVGEGTAVNWPAGAGGKGNEGVSAFVSRLYASIGYVEFAYAKQNKMTYVQLKNANGSWVAPNELTFKAAASSATWDKTYYQVLTEQKHADAWPITGATFVIIHKNPSRPGEVRAAMKFFEWAYTNGDSQANDLDYVPLPDSVKNKVRADWKRLGVN